MKDYWGLTEEMREGLFPFNVRGGESGLRWYSFDVSEWPLNVRPLVSQVMNEWLRRSLFTWCNIDRHARFVMNRLGIPTPVYTTILHHDMGSTFWIHDNNFDLTHIPEYNLCMKVGYESKKVFNYMREGIWFDWVMGKMLMATGRSKETLDFLNERMDLKIEACNILKKRQGIKRKPEWPSWVDDMVKELGAASRIV